MPDYASLNGTRVVSGRVCLPSYGLWTADLVLATPQVLPSTPGGLSLVLGNLTLTGTAFRQASYGSARSVRIVAGYGGWRKTLSPKSYQLPSGVPLSMVLGDAAQELGEPVPQLSAALQGATVGFSYCRAGDLGTLVLAQLATPYWWVQPNGVVFVGPRPTGAITSTFQVTEYAGREGRFTVAPDVIGDWLPGRSFTTPQIGTPNPISYVEHELPGTGSLRSHVLVQ